MSTKGKLLLLSWKDHRRTMFSVVSRPVWLGVLKLIFRRNSCLPLVSLYSRNIFPVVKVFFSSYVVVLSASTYLSLSYTHLYILYSMFMIKTKRSENREIQTVSTLFSEQTWSVEMSLLTICKLFQESHLRRTVHSRQRCWWRKKRFVR